MRCRQHGSMVLRQWLEPGALHAGPATTAVLPERYVFSITVNPAAVFETGM